MPSGVTFSNAGVLSGTPGSGSAGTYTVCINATNVAGTATPQKFTLTIGKFTPTVTVAGSLNNTTLTFTVTVTGTDGITPTGTPTWTIVSTPGGSVSCSSSTALSGFGSVATATCTYQNAKGTKSYKATANYLTDNNYAAASYTMLSGITG